MAWLVRGMDAPQEKTTPLRVEEVVDAVDLLSVDKQELLVSLYTLIGSRALHSVLLSLCLI